MRHKDVVLRTPPFKAVVNVCHVDYLCINKPEIVNKHLTFYVVSFGELRFTARAVAAAGQLSGEEAPRCPELWGTSV